MIGLALGSLTIGKKADAWDLKKIGIVYFFVEVGIGVYALLLPEIINSVESIYIGTFNILPSFLWSSVILKSIFAMSILFVPTFLMGTTLPLITKYLSSTLDSYSKNVSLLYGLNTFGAIIGTLIAGFFLLENYGISGATLFSASLNFLVAICFALVFKFIKSNAVVVESKSAVSKKKNKKPEKISIPKFDEFSALLLISYTISGAASMFYQISWTRSLSLIIGTSTYAFTTMLATFLLGITVGSLIYRYIPKNLSRVRAYVFLQFLIVVSILISTSYIDNLPFYYLSLNESYFSSWSDLHYIRFLLASLIMIIPTICMGILFPVVCDVLVSRNKKMTHTVGKTYAYTSIGATIGSILAGLVVVPLIGLQNTIYAGVFLNLFAFAIVLLQSDTFKNGLKFTFLFSAILIYFSTITLSDKWNPKVMSSGVYVYTDNYLRVSNNLLDTGLSKAEIWKLIMNNYELLYYQDGITDTVAVMKNSEGIISLMVNGKVDASAKSEHDIATQIMIGQLPLLLHKDPKKVFLVGYASGITAGSILTHPIEKLDAAEISSSVVDASKLFDKYNYNPLNDERMHLNIKDARHMLMVSDKNYDVIVSQPSNPWIKGQSSLFSYDWYQIVKEHLNDDGIFMQWLPAYHISEKNLKIIINTVNKSFPTLTLWSSGVAGDLIILASKNKNFKASYAKFEEKFKNENVKNAITRIGLKKETLLQELFLKGNKEIDKYLDDKNNNLPINSDDKLITQYTAPKNMINNKIVDVFVKPDLINVNDNSLKNIIPDL